MRATLELLENDELRRRMGAAAAERARREFSAARLVADIAALYERIAVATRSRLSTRVRSRSGVPRR